MHTNGRGPAEPSVVDEDPGTHCGQIDRTVEQDFHGVAPTLDTGCRLSATHGRQSGKWAEKNYPDQHRDRGEPDREAHLAVPHPDRVGDAGPHAQRHQGPKDQPLAARWVQWAEEFEVDKRDDAAERG